MGLLLWSLYATDHVMLRQSTSGGFSGLFEKIRHTIEDLF